MQRKGRWFYEVNSLYFCSCAIQCRQINIFFAGCHTTPRTPVGTVRLSASPFPTFRSASLFQSLPRLSQASLAITSLPSSRGSRPLCADRVCAAFLFVHFTSLSPTGQSIRQDIVLFLYIYFCSRAIQCRQMCLPSKSRTFSLLPQNTQVFSYVCK